MVVNPSGDRDSLRGNADIRSSRAQFLGFVDALDAKTAAEAAAVRAFNLDDWQRKRLLVRECQGHGPCFA
jgi:hypothetical protein